MSDDREHCTVEDETRPLLGVDHPRPTPLPKLQLTIVLLLQICEPITSQSIFPYINQLITELDITGGDDRSYQESLFFATEAMTVLQWSRLSDNIGRKPVLLTGMLGIIISMLAFGLSRTFWALVVSRCLTGLLNGNVGVMKSIMGELTDSTNRAEAYSLMPTVWGFGSSVGPLIGGSLSHPYERFPKAFSGIFWKDYPYFLPCLVTSAYVLFISLFAFFTLKETRPARKSRPSSHSLNSQLHDEPLPLHKLLVYPVILSVSNYVVLAFLNIAAIALLPLFLAMPLDIGGLNLDPPTIGYILGSYGTADAVFHGCFFAPIIRRWGERNVLVAGMSTFIPIFLLFPVITLVARGWGQRSLGVWILLGILLCLLVLMDMAYATIFFYINASTPDRRSLGATNGLSQTTVSIARAIGPALSTSLFSFSVEKNILGGFGVYVVFAIFSVFAVYLATRLPLKPWEHQYEPVEHE